MPEKDDYQRLASQFVDMWQKNMAAAMNDSEFIRAFLHVMQATSSYAKENSTYGNSTAPHTARPAAAPDAGHNAIARLEGRLADIEKRLSALERFLARFFAKTTAQPAKRMAAAAKRSGTGKGSGKRSRKKNS